MLKFDKYNKFYIVPTMENDWSYNLSRKPLLKWNNNLVCSSLSLAKLDSYYKEFRLNMFTSCFIQDIQLFRDELFKDSLVIGKFSFVQLDEIKKWRVELCSKPIPRVDITYKNNEIQAIRSYISPEDYKNEYCLKYIF